MAGSLKWYLFMPQFSLEGTKHIVIYDVMLINYEKMHFFYLMLKYIK